VEEIAPGLWHWTARHDQINMDVSSYYLLPERVVIDPMVPPEGLEWFEQREPPEHVLLTNRHHDRHAWRLREAFNCTVHCIRNGLHELEGRGSVEAFDFGDELPGGAVAFEVDAICPDETALHIAAKRALACADGVVRWPGQRGLSFVPDQFMDDPEQTKAACATPTAASRTWTSSSCCWRTENTSLRAAKKRCSPSYTPAHENGRGSTACGLRPRLPSRFQQRATVTRVATRLLAAARLLEAHRCRAAPEARSPERGITGVPSPAGGCRSLGWLTTTTVGTSPTTGSHGRCGLRAPVG